MLTATRMRAIDIRPANSLRGEPVTASQLETPHIGAGTQPAGEYVVDVSPWPGSASKIRYLARKSINFVHLQHSNQELIQQS